MLVLFCVQMVQTINNESNWKKKRKPTTFHYKQVKDMQTCQENIKS
jgi:hypothetical protein